MEGVEPRLTPKSLQESPRQPSSSGVVKGHLDHTFYSRARQALVERSLSGCFVSPLSTLPAAAQRRLAWTLPIEHSWTSPPVRGAGAEHRQHRTRGRLLRQLRSHPGWGLAWPPLGTPLAKIGDHLGHPWIHCHGQGQWFDAGQARALQGRIS